MFLEFEYDKQMFKARTIYGIFWRYKIGEIFFEIKDANRCILTVF